MVHATIFILLSYICIGMKTYRFNIHQTRHKNAIGMILIEHKLHRYYVGNDVHNF
jgi:hypothetical protein